MKISPEFKAKAAYAAKEVGKAAFYVGTGFAVGALSALGYVSSLFDSQSELIMKVRQNQSNSLEYRLTPEEQRSTTQGQNLEEYSLEPHRKLDRSTEGKLPSPESLLEESERLLKELKEGNQEFEDWLKERSPGYKKQEQPKEQPKKEHNWGSGPKTPESNYNRSKAVSNAREFLGQLQQYERKFGEFERESREVARGLQRASQAGDYEAIVKHMKRFREMEEQYNSQIDEVTELIDEANRTLNQELIDTERLLRMQEDILKMKARPLGRKKR